MAGSSVFLGGPKGPKWPKMVNLTVIHCESQNALCVFRARIQVLSEIVQNVSNWSTRVPDGEEGVFLKFHNYNSRKAV